MNKAALFRRLLMIPMVVPAFCVANVAFAQGADAWPTKPVRFLVGFAPGGANDLVARVVAAKLGPRLGQQLVVDNRPGAGGNIAHALLAKAAPDGYTMVLASVASLAMSPGLLGISKRLRNSPAARGLMPLHACLAR